MTIGTLFGAIWHSEIKGTEICSIVILPYRKRIRLLSIAFILKRWLTVTVNGHSVNSRADLFLFWLCFRRAKSVQLSVCRLTFLSHESSPSFITIPFLTFPYHPHLFTSLRDIDSLRNNAATYTKSTDIHLDSFQNCLAKQTGILLDTHRLLSAAPKDVHVCDDIAQRVCESYWHPR